MSERFTKVFSFDNLLYAAGAPLVIRAGALLKDTTTGRMLVQLKLQNVDGKAITYAKVSIQPLDSVNNPLGDAFEYDYLDMTVGTYDFFGSKKAIFLPNPSTRAFLVSVLSVGFADNSVWQSDGTPWTVSAPDAPISILISADDTYKVALPLVASQQVQAVTEAKAMLESILPIRDVSIEIAQCEQNIASLIARAEEAKKKAKKTKILIVIVASVFLLFLLVMVIYNYVTSEVLPQKAKDEADRLQVDQQYIEAFDAYYNCYYGSFSKVDSDYILLQVQYALWDMVHTYDIEAAYRYLHHVGNNYIYGMDDVLGGDTPLSFSYVADSDWGAADVDATKLTEALISVLKNPDFFRLDYPESCAMLLDYEINLLKSCLNMLEFTQAEIPFEFWEAVVSFCLKYDEVYTINYTSSQISKTELERYVDNMLKCYIWKGNLSGLFEYGNKNAEFMEKVLSYAPTGDDIWQSIDQARLWDGISAFLNSKENFIMPSSGGAIYKWKMQLMRQAFRHINRSFNNGDSLILQDLFENNSSSTLKEELYDHREYIDQVWHYKVMRDIFLRGEGLIYFVLEGKWYVEKDDGELSSVSYIEFDLTRKGYGNYQASVSWEYINAPQTTAFYYFMIEDCVLNLYAQSDDTWIASAFRFEFSNSPDEFDLYCYEDGETLHMR